MDTSYSKVLADDFRTRLVIFGAGELGRRIARGLSGLGITPLAFCDNRFGVCGTEIDGLRAMSPGTAVKLFPEAVFMVAIWHPSKTEGLRQHVVELQTIGCQNIVSFIPLFWMYPKIFLPTLFWENPLSLRDRKDLIAEAREGFDDLGKAEFDRQLKFRLTGDFESLHNPLPGLQYFPEDLVSLSDDETFVDCGAYDGDTVRDFVSASGGRFRRIIALEPDSHNFRSLVSSIHDSRIRLLPYAAGAKCEVLLMSSTGASSSVSASGGTEVQCAVLDEVLSDENPTFIKMDIEGSEVAALHGAEATIRRCRPKLAICVYHRPDDLWQIPLLLKKLTPDSILTLRSHMLDGFDTVCYCIPNA